jgi:hypothetical protein
MLVGNIGKLHLFKKIKGLNLNLIITYFSTNMEINPSKTGYLEFVQHPEFYI